MADFCKKCEIELFGKSYLNLHSDKTVLCEGCGGVRPYGDMMCVDCGVIVQYKMYETGLECFCKCQCSLNAEWDRKKWISV